MVTAMQASGEDDDAIRAALTLAKSQDTGAPKAARPAGPYSEGYLLESNRKFPPFLSAASKSQRNEDAMAAQGGPRSEEYKRPGEPDAGLEAQDRMMGALGSSFTDNFALGLPGRVLDTLPAKLQPYLGGTREQRDTSRAQSPVGDIAGATLGQGLSGVAGPEALIGKGVQASVPAAASPVGRIAANAVIGAGTGGIGEGARASMNPDSPESAGEAALRGMIFGGVLGGGLSTVGEAAGGISNLLRKDQQIGTYAKANEAGAYDSPDMKALPKGREGIRRAAEKGLSRVVSRDQELGDEASKSYQAAVGPPRRPPQEGTEYIDAPVLRGDRTSQAVEDIVGPRTPEQTSLFDATRAINSPGSEPTRNYSPQIPVRTPAEPAEGLARPVDRKALIDALQAARSRQANPDTGQPYNKTTDAKFQAAIDALGPNGRTVEGHDVQRWEPQRNTVGGVLGQRRALRKEGAFNSPSPTEGQQASRDVYHEYRGAVRKAAPDVAAADDAYAQFASKAQRRRDIVFNTENEVLKGGSQSPVEHADTIGDVPQTLAEDLGKSPTDQLRVGKAKAGATNLGRIGDTNDPGNAMAPFLDELAAQDPEFAAALNFIRNKKAQEGTRFGLNGQLPESLTSVNAAVGPALKQNARAIGAHILDPAARGTSNFLGRSLRALPGFIPQIEQDFQSAIDRLRQQQEQNQ